MLAELEDLKMERWFRGRNNGNIIWKTKDGKLVPIKDLSDNHLNNIINMIEDNEHKEMEYMEALSSFPDKYLW